MKVALFKKKPVIVEAMQYTRIGLEAEKVAKWCGGTQTDDGLIVHTLNGDVLADYGDWIIRGVHGEFYPCDPKVFEETYASMEDSE
jgi:hypothetical protein